MTTLRTCALLATIATPTIAQQELPRLRIELGLGGGTLEHRTDGSDLDGDTDAGAFRLGFEAFGKTGIGGGVRYGAWATDDDLFDGAGYNPTEGSTSELFAHFSYRFGDADFAMPWRTGLLLHDHHLDDRTLDQVADFATVGILTELAPEIFLSVGERVSWSVTGSACLGAGLTRIDSDALANDYDATTLFYGAEIGTRVRIDAIELGLSFVARGHQMDESNNKGGLSVLGYESTFTGVMLTVGAVF